MKRYPAWSAASQCRRSWPAKGMACASGLPREATTKS